MRTLFFSFVVVSRFFFNCILGFGVHVKNMQDSCLGTHLAVWFAAFLPFTYIWHFSPCYPSPSSPPPTVSPLPFPTSSSVWCSSPWVHMFSLFNIHLWVRTCCVWLSVLVSVCWELWFPDSSKSLQRTRTHHFYGCIVFHGVYVPHFLCPVYHWWAFGLVPGLCCCTQGCSEHTCACVFIVEQFIVLGYMPSNGISGPNGISISKSLTNSHTVFHSGWTNLHSCQLHKIVPISPHHLQHLSPDFLWLPF